MADNVIKHTLKDALSGLGFRKMSGSWYRRSDDITQIVNLQKSNYGDVYYVNVGWWLTNVESVAVPKEHQAHVRIRLGELMPDGGGALRTVLNLDASLPDQERAESLRSAVTTVLAPLLDRTLTLTGVREAIGDQLRGAAVRGVAYGHLGLDAPTPSRS